MKEFRQSILTQYWSATDKPVRLNRRTSCDSNTQYCAGNSNTVVISRNCCKTDI